jgi:hypothetical protein
VELVNCAAIQASASERQIHRQVTRSARPPVTLLLGRWWLLGGGCSVVLLGGGYSVVAARWWLRGRRDQVRHEVGPGVVDLTPHRAVEVLQGHLSQHVDAGDLEADRVEIAGVHAARSRAIRAVTGPVAAS